MNLTEGNTIKKRQRRTSNNGVLSKYPGVFTALSVKLDSIRIIMVHKLRLAEKWTAFAMQHHKRT